MMDYSQDNIRRDSQYGYDYNYDQKLDYDSGVRQIH